MVSVLDPGVLRTLFLLAGALTLARLIWWDLRAMILPNGLVALLAALGIGAALVAPFPGQTLAGAALGAALAGGVFWSIRAVMSWALGTEALGLGDVTFAAAAGVWIGWAALPAFMLAGSFLGVVSLALPAFRQAAGARQVFPFGPALCLGAAAVMAAQMSGVPVGWLDPAVLGRILG